MSGGEDELAALEARLEGVLQRTASPPPADSPPHAERQSSAPQGRPHSAGRHRSGPHAPPPVDGYSLRIDMHPACRPTDWEEAGGEMPANPDWTLRTVLSEVEAWLLGYRLRVSAALLIDAKRDKAVPLLDKVSEHFSASDLVLVAGDVHRLVRDDSVRKSVGGAHRHAHGHGHSHSHGGHVHADGCSSCPHGGADQRSPPRQRPDDKHRHDRDHRVPVTILTGFLGSGKTTMLNHLLHVQRDHRIAVIENEFGEVPIDNELLSANKMDLAEQVVVLENGCMCCTVRGDLLGAFQAVYDAMDPQKPLFAVLVETTGMADPVPIVRTFVQTPAINERFRLDGVVTLADAKNLAGRLAEDGPSPASPSQDEDKVDEAFQQIMFADRLVLNKIDLVTGSEAVAALQSLRSINRSARTISCTRGRVDPADIMNIRAFSMAKLSHDDHFDAHAHAHSHSHSHGGAPCDGGGGCDHAHSVDSRHSSQVGSFSIVREDQEVDILEFSRWVRSLSRLTPDRGKLYRSKAVLAAAGSRRKLAFHAVSDVVEKEWVGEWAPGERRVCKIVFIGKKLDRKFFSEAWEATLRPVRPPLSAGPRAGGPRPLELLAAAAPCLASVLLHLSTRDAGRLARVNRLLCDAVYADDTAALLAVLAQECAKPPLGRHTRDPAELYVHPFLPMRAAATYTSAAKKGRVEIPDGGLSFASDAEVEAAGVTWCELAPLTEGDSTVRNIVLEFGFREETILEFLRTPGAAVFSTQCAVVMETDDDEDELKWKLRLQPADKQPGDEAAPAAGAAAFLQYRLVMRNVRTVTENVYMAFFHSIDPTFQVHIPIKDHRVPYTEADLMLHKWHPLITSVQRSGKVRFLARIKPDGSGPLDAMCGCC
eukprot:TRINITY_DN17253_c0_g1_i1.p1 TRINITY_DN17253_c0_g1~~TRINITY_DN17253_c0_g1_i1.p1  ORF type:complete len:901 (+),score=293.26 TRINITY_DN17253_c0_g1_i1:70-2703(+)